MAKFRFITILFFVIMPPIVYVAAIHFVEQYAGRKFQAGLEKSYLGDASQLLNGVRPIKEVIDQNVTRYIAKSSWLAMGCQASVTIKTRKNSLLYPLYEIENTALVRSGIGTTDVAIENFELISEYPEVFSSLKVPHKSILAMSVLAGCLFFSLAGLSLYYRQWHRRNKAIAIDQAKEHDRLISLGDRYYRQMTNLEDERAMMADELKQMESTLLKEKAKTNANEEEMLEQLIALEDKISEKTNLHENQQKEIEQLRLKLEQIDNAHQKKYGAKSKAAEMAKKRLATLYKKINIKDRAVTGYLNLADDLKIKCEEVIHQLNDDPSKVKIKRKVFGKKNRLTVLEVVFGYKGRLYYRLLSNRNADVLVIGTKNSQQTDLAYLERL